MKTKILIILIVLIIVTVVYAADVKWSALAENTTVADDDVLCVIDTSGGGSKKITVLNFFDTIDAFSEIDAIVADKSLVNLEDGGTFTGGLIANANLSVGNATTTAGVLTLLEDDDDGANFASFMVPALAANTVYTLPPDDGDNTEVLQTDGSGTLTWVANAGGATAYDDIGDPDAASSITFADGETVTWATAEDSAGSFFLIQNSDADLAANTYLLDLDYSVDDNQANADYFRCQDAGGGGVVFSIQQNGDTVSTGTIGGTTITASTAHVAPLFDAAGNEDLDIGSADVDDITLITDGGTYIFDDGLTAIGEDLGSTSAEWDDLFLNDGGVIQLGDDQDVLITHVADTGILLTGGTDEQLQIGDSGTYINQQTDGTLNLTGDTIVEITAPNLRLEFDDAAYLNIATADGGITTISQVSDGTDEIKLGDSADLISVDSGNWDVSNAGVFSGLTGITSTGVIDFSGATSIEIPNATDPDVDAAGEISNDTDGANETGDVIIRGFDGSNQFPVGRKLKTLNFTLVEPDQIDAYDLIPVWHNTSGMTFTIVEWKAWSDDDNVSFEIEELTDQTNYTAITQVDACEVATDGTGVFYGSDATITHAAIEHDHSLAIDFDGATDTPDYVQIAITGWFNADIN